MDKETANNNNANKFSDEPRRIGLAMPAHKAKRMPKRNNGGIGADGKPITPIVITVVFVLMMLVAVYFGKVEGWFKGSDPASVEVTVPPDVTPQPTYNAARPISTLDEKSLRIVALDVGQGSCTLMLSPNGKTLLFGSGDEAHAAAVIEELSAYGVKSLDVVFADSADEGHIGGMTKVAEAFDIGTLYAPESLLEDAAESGLARQFEASGTVVNSVAAGTVKNVQWDKSCSVRLFAENRAAGEACLALRVEYNSASFLLAGMLDFAAEDALIASAGEDALKSTVLFVAGCGADDCTGNAFLNAVAPSHAVISVGSGAEASGCPAKETLSRLNAHSVKQHRTDRNGTVIMTVDKNGLNII